LRCGRNARASTSGEPEIDFARYWGEIFPSGLCLYGLFVLIVISTEDPTRCPAAHVLPTPKCDGQTDRDPLACRCSACIGVLIEQWAHSWNLSFLLVSRSIAKGKVSALVRFPI
jgi:hypothetical protein